MATRSVGDDRERAGRDPRGELGGRREEEATMDDARGGRTLLPPLDPDPPPRPVATSVDVLADPHRHDPRRPLESNPGVYGGEPVFPGTRTPARLLLDNLSGGETFERFLDDYPEVRREDAEDLLTLLRDHLGALARYAPADEG